MKINWGPSFRFPCGKANTKLGIRLRQQPRSGRDESGSAVLIIFILLTLMVAYLISNGRVLYHLQEEIRLINRQQLQKYVLPPPPVGTNLTNSATIRTPP